MFWLRIPVSLPFATDSPIGEPAPMVDTGDQESRSMLRLPCPAVELLGLIDDWQLDRPVPRRAPGRKQLWRRLRANPSLMIHALASYREQQREAAATPRALVTWSQDHWLERLFESASQLEACESYVEPDESEWESLLRARNHRRTSKALRRWLRLDPSDRSREERGQLVDGLLGPGFRFDSLPCPGIRKSRTRRLVMSRWIVNSSQAVDVAMVLRLAASHHQLQTSFAAEVERKKLAAMKELAYGASHEINNPLANIATRAQTMLTREDHPEKQRKLAVIYQQAMRAHEMISDMMLFAHPPAMNSQSVSLRLLLRKFLAQQQEVLDQFPSVEVRITIGQGIDRVEVDSTQILVALACLLRNSLEAIRARRSQVGIAAGGASCSSGLAEAGRVEINLSCSGSDWLEISILDNGIGIDQRVAEHLFDPFFSGREAGRGLGFGLAKVWRIAQLHGGTVVHDRAHATATRFVMRLPVTRQTGVGGDQDLSLVGVPQAGRGMVQEVA